jgi:Effector Associated Constant Component 1
VSLQLSVKGDEPVGELEELSDWLRQESELRGLVSPAAVVPGPGELGALSDALVVAVGSGGTLSVLAASLKMFLAQPRRSDVRIVVTAPDGRRVELDAKRVSNVEQLLRQLLGDAG